MRLKRSHNNSFHSLKSPTRYLITVSYFEQILLRRICVRLSKMLRLARFFISEFLEFDFIFQKFCFNPGSHKQINLTVFSSLHPISIEIVFKRILQKQKVIVDLLHLENLIFFITSLHLHQTISLNHLPFNRNSPCTEISHIRQLVIQTPFYLVFRSHEIYVVLFDLTHNTQLKFSLNNIILFNSQIVLKH